MCLVFLATRADPGRPLLVAANREESRRRPGTSPVCRRIGPLRALLAGADRGPDGSFPEIGTWLGVNEAGLVVAVTNRRDGELPWEQQTRSRGLLAVALLGFDDPAEAARHACEDLARGGYGGGNFLIADARRALVVQAPGAGRISVEELPPGVHALTNRDVDDRDDPRIRFAREALDPGHFLASARRICRDDRVVIAGAERGTVSSTLVLVGDDIRFDHLRGDPRAAEYETFSPFPLRRSGPDVRG